MQNCHKIFVIIIFIAINLCINYNHSAISQTTNCVVKFDFDGLQALAFGDFSRVSDGILDAHHHQPNIQIKQLENGKETIIENIKADELKGKVLNVDVANTNGKEVAPTRYYSSDMNKDTSDFRWCLDIENDLFQKQLYLKDQFLTKIHFNTGTFYSERLTEEKYQFVVGDTLHSFKRQIGRPTLKIELSKDQNLVIAGLDKKIELPFISGITYGITVSNLPPKDMMNINHFAFYYDAVKTDVPRFMPIAVKKASFLPRPVICEAAIFGKSTIK